MRRSHLLTSFNDSPGTLIIRGEGGAGKTTLVTQWLEQSTVHVTWVTVSQQDHHPTVAWRKLLLCRTSPQIRFMLTIRERINFKTDPSLIASRMQVITSADLAFTLAETTALCAEMTAEMAARLFDDSAGTRHVLQRFEEQVLEGCEYRVDHESFRFHILIQIALAERAATEITLKPVTRIRRIAFQALEGRADPVAVFELGLEAHLDTQTFSFFAGNVSELSLVRS